MKGLITAVLERSTGKHSQIHGEDHWKRVGMAGLMLAPETGADPRIVFLFALFHDSMRLNDMRDPDHGPRGADLAIELLEEAPDDLIYAIDYHTDGLTSTDPTVGTCWDADRLNLWRVGKKPDPRFFSTEAAMDLLGWARRLQYKTVELPQILRML